MQRCNQQGISTLNLQTFHVAVSKKKKQTNNPIKKIGRRSTNPFLQIIHTGGQEAHENILNITNYQLSANQNYNEISLHTSQNDHHQKTLQTINAGESVEKREPSYTVGGNVNWYTQRGTV